MEKRTSLFENGLIWFGAGVSIAEILTGTYFAVLDLAEAGSHSGRTCDWMYHVVSGWSDWR